MIRRAPISTSTDKLLPFPTLFRSSPILGTWAIRRTAVNPPGQTARLNPGGFISNQSSKGQIMQRVDCQVRLSGKLTHTVGKKNISVAEIVALRAIHGADAVVDVQPKANDKTPHAAEMDHLRKT